GRRPMLRDPRALPATAAAAAPMRNCAQFHPRFRPRCRLVTAAPTDGGAAVRSTALPASTPGGEEVVHDPCALIVVDRGQSGEPGENERPRELQHCQGVVVVTDLGAYFGGVEEG